LKTLILLAFSLLFAIDPQNAQARQEFSVHPDLSKSGNIAQWDLDGSGIWRIDARKLILSKAGTPSGFIRRPAALAILNMQPVQRVTIEADIRSTAPADVVRRDLDIIVGYESPTRFYYVHLAAVSDDVHNGIFRVKNADRVRIDSGGAKPQLADFSWHHVRVDRDGRTGRIAVYMDGSRAPVLQATDTTIGRGRVGVGSFDDTGEFRDIVIEGFDW